METEDLMEQREYYTRFKGTLHLDKELIDEDVEFLEEDDFWTASNDKMGFSAPLHKCKFYDYKYNLQLIIDDFLSHDIKVISGAIYFRGDNFSDVGMITIDKFNKVNVKMLLPADIE